MLQDPDPPPPSQEPPPSLPAGDEPAPLDDSAIDDLLGADELRANALDFLQIARETLLSVDVGVQALILFAALLPAALFGPQLRKLISSQIAPRLPYGVLRRAASAFAYIATPIALLVSLQAAVIVLPLFGRPTEIIEAGVSLLTAWIVIRLVTLVIRSPFWSRVAFYVAWPIAALDAFGLLGRVVRELDAFAFQIGTDTAGEAIKYSALDLFRTIVIFTALFWLANILNRFIKGRIGAIDELTTSFKALLSKILDVLLPVIALVVALQVVGFPFTTLAIFGGAVGLGLGLGLQKTVSNFFAGFTLIADKSIRPGDVIEIEDTFGWITEMTARYVGVRTRDGTEHLIPNEKFIQDGVINWSHSDRVVRLHAGVRVAYTTSDLRAVKKLCEETALTVERVLKTPAPICNLMEFGENSVEFDLRFWINDPANGISNVKSAVMLAVWDTLRDHNIEIPLPQLDLRVKSWPGDGAPVLKD